MGVVWVLVLYSVTKEKENKKEGRKCAYFGAFDADYAVERARRVVEKGDVNRRR